MQPMAADRKQPRRRTRKDLLASPFRADFSCHAFVHPHVPLP
jgi:hypothetical protein